VDEGLSAIDVVREAAEHAAHHREAQHERHDRLISIAEAVVLSVVTLVAAWSGYAAAKWSTESRFEVSDASTLRSKANRAFQVSMTLRAVDSSKFNAWFAAVMAGDRNAARVARHRFRPEYLVAFDAWIATHPFTNPDAPPGPQAMPQYHPTGEAESRSLDAAADAEYTQGQHAGETADDYIRTTVILASVLFLVGISSHFPIRTARLCLLAIAAALLVVASATILQFPSPP
jgi:hypothetical protein